MIKWENKYGCDTNKHIVYEWYDFIGYILTMAGINSTVRMLGRKKNSMKVANDIIPCKYWIWNAKRSLLFYCCSCVLQVNIHACIGRNEDEEYDVGEKRHKKTTTVNEMKWVVKRIINRNMWMNDTSKHIDLDCTVYILMCIGRFHQCSNDVV